MSLSIRPLSKTEFPPLLREIPDPPETLFISGILPPPDTIFLTVVGSRKYSSYGKSVCENLIKGLSGYPIAIVSGLAIGIDTIAHRAALLAGLPTIAVPGSGLSPKVLYPAQNFSLAEEIVEKGGALLSEYEPDFEATPWSFPKRNRIMAGLSRATLVIEAERPSGTLVTAKLALEYNRDVFSVPGSIFSDTSAGANFLIASGAVPITESADILRALSLPLREPLAEDAPHDLSEEERRVWEMLGEPLPKDELVRALGIDISRAQMLVSSMEIKGLLREQMGVIERIGFAKK